MKSSHLLGLLTAVAMGSAAQAAPIVQSYTFQNLLNDNSKTVTGGFTLLQDTATQTASLQSIDFKIGSTVYTTATALLGVHNVVGSPDAFILYGNINTPFGQGVQGTTEDFYFTFNPFTLTAWDFAYSEANPTYFVRHSTGGNAIIAKAAAAPEPATWTMMIGGFGMVGAAMRRRKAVVRFT